MTSIFRDNRRLLVFIILSNFLLNFGFQVWQTLFNNYAVESIGAGPAQIGLIQAVREIPGLLGFIVAFLVLIMTEFRLMALSVIVMGVGIALTGYANSVGALLASTFIMSLGFHFFMPSNNSVVLMMMKAEDTPKTLGNLGSLASLASVAGTGAVLLFAASMGYTAMFVSVGVLVVLAGAALLPFGNRQTGLPKGRKVQLRKEYWLYYALSFLLGSRRHIFTTFAVYLLVREFGVSVQTIAMLFLVNGIINVVTLRWTGQLVGKIGERAAMSIAFASLAVIFLGYAYATFLPLLFTLFILDNIFFGFNVSLSSYFQKIAFSKDEITANVSTQQAIEHIAAITVPLIGGTVWAVYGSEAPFLFGVVIVLLGLALAQFMRVKPAPEALPAGGN
ncbi:MAG: MFS transporter [Anaerolineae bacterium]|nr:MFS transporter [Anaerolineae bacterium]